MSDLADDADIIAIYSPRLRELIERVYFGKGIAWEGPPPNASAKELTRWREETQRKIKALVQAEHGAAIEDLLEYLAPQLSQK